MIRVRFGAPLRFSLDWSPPDPAHQPVDLDLCCLYRTVDDVRGAVQAVGREGGPGPPTSLVVDGEPVIELGRDDSALGRPDGEHLVVHRPQHLAFLVVGVSIYGGATEFGSVGAVVTVHRGQRRLRTVELGSSAAGMNWCAVLVAGHHDRRLYLVAEERYFLSAYHADRHYGFGLSWGLGSKHRSPTRH